MTENQEGWSQAAESTPDVFGLPTIAPQGQDGTAHFNYYDNERHLSFQWDGRLEQHVTVSHGGYGERVKWTFDFMEIWRLPGRIVAGPTIREPFLDTCLHFKNACDIWIGAMEQEMEEE